MISRILLSLGLLVALPAAAQPVSAASGERVLLDAAAEQNLRLATAMAEAAEFEETLFALGRVAVYPGHRAVVSSRIPGRAVEVRMKPDHQVAKGDTVVIVESRQFADPPPTVALTAPITGLVSAVDIAPGEPVSPDDELAEILDLSVVYALARVPEHLAGRLERGLVGRITVPAVPGRVFEARLEHLGVVADEASGTVEAAFLVPNPDLVLRPGLRAEFAIVVDQRSGVVSVPRAALQGDPANRFVYLRDRTRPHAFLRTPVVTGQTSGQRVEIVQGVQPGDEVVVDGAYSLAFAGEGGLSLKEALDAAHGHDHHPDGSEIEGSHDGHEDHHHSEGHGAGRERFWMIVSAVLFVLLLVVGFGRAGARRRGAGDEPGPA